ncbi:hypothetical protein [Chryseobacterium salviniae]|uniref:Uncharacterized protein n=1 Tax=Chryseobacterium salviniae TaxID=3101750 RepID=A0ABU6HU05_9FLAO|nr:hypothetical protein [Chryseobacterium sp. T9W2-O]MEC3876328.1 hypothetical protein [Chryseobacterium sp. T9W2-O]
MTELDFQAPFFIFATMEMYFILSAMVCFFIFGNLAIHLHYKKKHQTFLQSLKGKQYMLFKKLDMEMESVGKLGYRYQFNKADIVILDQEIFILLFTKPFGMAQPILHISNSDKVFQHIPKKIRFDSKFRVNGKLRIKGSFGQGFMCAQYKILIDFNKVDFDLNSII